MSSTMTLCPDCRTIQKASTVCTICGAKVRSPSLLLLLPNQRRGNYKAEAKNSDPTGKADETDAA